MPLRWQLDRDRHDPPPSRFSHLDDHTFGPIGLACTIPSFGYYTCWTLLTPFLPDSSPLLALSPLPREWAIRIAALVILVGLCFVAMLTGFVLVETAHKNGATLVGRRDGSTRTMAQKNSRKKKRR
ncbi:hypothetical protein RHOSPDRAFT_33891 [Rhodotorula sp. JG-1b]|nr:hypothetical protein RHOSPDRAFT_33891 [Rhodotorula sp. JG-1b]